MRDTITFSHGETNPHGYYRPPSRANEITQEYYWFLVREINRGRKEWSVCRVEYRRLNHVRYFLTSN